MTRSIIAIAASAFLLGASLSYLLTRVTDGEVVAANARAAALADSLRVTKALADEALEAHRLAGKELAALEAKRAPAVERFRAPRPVPVVCDTIVREIRAEAERIIEIDSTRIAVLEEDNARLTSALTETAGALADARRELEAQAKRTEKAPRRLLGVLPVPELAFGYGATHLDGKLRHGPQLTLGFKVPL